MEPSLHLCSVQFAQSTCTTSSPLFLQSPKVHFVSLYHQHSSSRTFIQTCNHGTITSSVSSSIRTKHLYNCTKPQQAATAATKAYRGPVAGVCCRSGRTLSFSRRLGMPELGGGSPALPLSIFSSRRSRSRSRSLSRSRSRSLSLSALSLSLSASLSARSRLWSAARNGGGDVDGKVPLALAEGNCPCDGGPLPILWPGKSAEHPQCLGHTASRFSLVPDVASTERGPCSHTCKQRLIEIHLSVGIIHSPVAHG